MNAHTKETQASVTPQQSVEVLLEGNKRFVSDEKLNRNLNEQVSQTAGGQFPISAVLSCIDSRIPTEMIFDQGIGDIFNARIAGNFINEDILGSLEFACKVAGAKSIVVLGHTSCGAVRGAVDDAQLGNLTQMLAKIKPAIQSTETVDGEPRDSSSKNFLNAVSRNNVALSIEAIRTGSPVLKEMEDNGEIVIAGAMYDVATGKVEQV